jgi:subtilisin family serine protease
MTASGTSMASPHVAGLAAYLIALEGINEDAVLPRLNTLATPGKLLNLDKSSPNLLAYNGNGA